LNPAPFSRRTIVKDMHKGMEKEEMKESPMEKDCKDNMTRVPIKRTISVVTERKGGR
jgi:hypothetical protein